MAHSKTLQQQVDELRAEIAALQAERAALTAPEPEPEPEPETEAEPEAVEETAGGPAATTLGELEKALTGLLETTENEIAEHPAIVAGLAFLAGIAVGRMSKGSAR